VAISDIHGDLRMIRKLKDEIVNLKASGIIIAGDIGPNAEKVLFELSRLELPIYAILGNDDDPVDEETIEDIPYVINVNKRAVNIGGVTLIGLAGAVRRGVISPNDWTDEENTFKKLDHIFSNIKNPTIFLTHCPPFGILDYATFHGEAHIGSKAVRKIIRKYRPLLCICGHVHKDGGKRAQLESTQVVNIAGLLNDEASKSLGRRFAVINIAEDRKSHRVEFDYLVNANLPLEEFIKTYI
jgi:hypothetical protein